MMQFRKIVSGALTFTTALTMSGLGMVGSAYAAPLTESKVQLSDSRGATSSSHTITFKAATAVTIKGFRLTYANRASGSVVIPDTWAGGAATLTHVKKNGGAALTGWTIDVTEAATNGRIFVLNATGVALSSGDTVEIELAGLTNNTATISGGNECDTVANSDTCYTRIETHNSEVLATMNAGSSLQDSSVASYTVIAPVTVTATVDPSLTFTLAGVTNSNISTNDTNASCANAVTSTATTLPFGNLGVGIANNKCAQQSINVATNAAYGYDVYYKFLGAVAATNMMVGTISGNNIDPYTGTFGTPTAFASSPSGTTQNVNSGWLGVRSTNIGGFSGSNLYAAPSVNTTASPGDIVMTSSTPDIGTTATYVTFKIAVNALQPADTYTGTGQYNIVARY
jgi:hypothetical protein